AILTVEGDFLWERSHTNPGPLALDLRGNAQFNCLGNLEAKLTGGDMIDFYITDQSTFTVEGDMTLLNTTPDDTIQVVLGDDGGSGTLTVGGNLNINSTAAGNLSEIRANGANTIINVGEDISLSAVDTCTSRLSLLSSSSLNLAGTILRPNNFGILTMGADAVLNLNGTEPQILAPNNLAGSGMDSLLYTNITFNNTSGSPTTLTGPLVVEDQLAMDGGIIRSSASNPLILEDNATIGVGSSTSFIDGPIIKKGRTGDGGITLPTGKDGVYAPIKISEMADEDGEITAEYFSEPPPFGNDNTNFESVVEDISQQGYWSVEKSAEVGDVNYTLHWTDAQALGIYDLSSLIVVGLDNNTWRSYGQGATTGGVGPGVEGSITNAYSEPPPFGIEYLTFGSTSASNKLPVELSKFVAIPQGGKVRLQWQTLTEVDFSHFVIERSKDGYYFERLGFVESKGGNTVTDYTYDDPSPLNNWNYYRLKIIDTDDTYEYSDIEIVKIDDMEQFQLYPNPVRDQIEIKGIDWDNGQLKLEVFDKNGKLVYSNFTDFENGYYEVTTEAIHVQQPGIYFIRLSTGTRSQYLKFVKVND
ncbi:MAG: T9SS type A sorting domain-containing protein, partial [Bacteroidota bacterium]